MDLLNNRFLDESDLPTPGMDLIGWVYVALEDGKLEQPHGDVIINTV